MRTLLLATLGLALGCTPPEATSPTAPRMEYGERFFFAPYPSAHRERPDGTLDLADFPTQGNSVVARFIDALGTQAEGFGLSTGLWFPVTGPIDSSTLPQSPADSASFDSALYLVNIDEGSPTLGQFVPLRVAFKDATETYSPANLVVALPEQGRLLEPRAWYAAVLTRRVRDPAGLRLARAPFLAQDRSSLELDRLWAFLKARKQRADDVIAATVFRAGDPTARLSAMAQAVRRLPAPPYRLGAVRDLPNRYLVEGEVELPLFQQGEKPYSAGGAIAFDAQGAPIEQAREWVRLSVSVPKQPMPADGYPLLVHAAGSGGNHLTPTERETSPGAVLSPRGIAVLGTEPHLTGQRHPSQDASGVILFNVFAPAAMVNNFRQWTSEQLLLASLAKTLRIPGSLLPGLPGAPSEVRFDSGQLFVHGQSTGSIAATLALGLDDRFRAGLLTGAGGSWTYTLVMKQTPSTAELVKAVLNFKEADEVDVFDPVLHLAATSWEPIEPLNYAPLWLHGPARQQPASVLLVEGLLDSFFPPPMVNALAVSSRLDQLGPAVEPTLAQSLEPVGGKVLEGPVTANREAQGHSATQVVVQYQAKPGRNGHFVAFELEPAMHQYACFLATAAASSGASPRVPPGGTSRLDPCP